MDVNYENSNLFKSISKHKDENNNNFLNCNEENESYKINKDKRNTIIKLINSLNKDENGAFINKKFVKEIYLKRNDLNKLSIKDSYLPYTEWYGLYINDADIDIKVEDEDVDEYEDSHDYEMILIRISDLIEPLKFKKLILNEYKLNKELCQLEYGVSPKFKGYSFFNTKAISIFFTQLHCTLAEHLKGKDRNKKYIILELVKKLELLHPQDGKCFLTSTLSPNNILWSKNEFYTIIFTEIFSTVERDNAVITLENFPISKWYVPEYNKLNESKQFTLSYYSSVQSFGYVLFYLLTGSEPPESEEEWNYFFNDNSKIYNSEYNLFKNIIKECINASETNPISFSLLYKKLEKVDESIFEKSILPNSISNDIINTQLYSQVQEEMKPSSTELSLQSTLTETNNNIIIEQPLEISQLPKKKKFSEITHNTTNSSLTSNDYLSKEQTKNKNINNESVNYNNSNNSNNDITLNKSASPSHMIQKECSQYIKNGDYKKSIEIYRQALSNEEDPPFCHVWSLIEDTFKKIGAIKKVKVDKSDNLTSKTGRLLQEISDDQLIKTFSLIHNFVQEHISFSINDFNNYLDTQIKTEKNSHIESRAYTKTPKHNKRKRKYPKQE